MKVVTYRDALVVGVNQYLFLKDSKNKAKHLKTPASDAEAIAQRLEKYGGFKVRRLPESIQDGQRQVEANPPKPIDAETLENAIIQLFNPTGENIPQTALLYFIGHGLRKNRGGVTEGFLATSDVHPQRNQWGVSLRWLRELLQKSPVPQQIVWLDCCYSGELLNFTEADLGTAGQGQTRFLIAAAREFELAEEDIQGQHGVFSQALWGGLDPKQQPDGVVNNDRLIAHITQALKDIPQQPIWYNPNSEIILTGEQEEVFTPTPDGICPYKGLRFFDVEDAPYFYGREALTERLIERVQVGKANFLAVLGVSGSGKSSLLRAGLMYQLQQKRRLPGTELWKIRFFTPGAQPLVGLATAFLDEEVTDIERAKQLKEAEEAVLGGEGLARLIKVSKFPRTLLIVDQFEEVFTVCQSQTDRQKFIFTLLDALKETGDKLCLIFAMRDDFLGKCATYWELADLMQNNLVIVTPMNTEELRRAIIEPAKKLGCKIEENLINTIFKDLRVVIPHLYAQNELMLSEPEPGFLPLLSYTLEQLWQRKTLNWLKLDSYIQLGGVQKTLENLAEDVYKSFLPEEQRIANQIFIKLTQLGDGAPDTRKQVAQQDLVTEPKSTALIERVIQKLVQAKLIITSEQRKGNKKVAVVDVSHEVLIRHWSRLRELLDSNRGNIKTERKIQFAAEEWQDKGKPNDFTYLLQGEKLVEAENFLYQKVEFVHLSVLAHEFVQISQLQRDKDKVARDRERKLTLLRTVFSMGFVIIAGWLIWQFLISFKLNKDLDKLKQQISGALPIKGTENFTFKNIVVNNKMVWMSVYNHENKGLGLWQYNLNNKKLISYLPNEEITTILLDEAEIWVAVKGKGIKHANLNEKNTSFNLIKLEGINSEIKVLDLARDNQGKLWIGTSKGLYRPTAKKWISTTNLQSLCHISKPTSSFRTEKIVFDSEHNLMWMATTLGLISFSLRSDSEIINCYLQAQEILPSNNLTSLYLDSQKHILAVGNYEGNLSLIVKGLVSADTQDDELINYPPIPKETIRDIIILSQKIILINTQKIYAFRYDSNKPVLMDFFVDKNKEVKTIVLGKNNIIWIGTNKGLYHTQFSIYK